jgi:hypothetical protein
MTKNIFIDLVAIVITKLAHFPYNRSDLANVQGEVYYRYESQKTSFLMDELLFLEHVMNALGSHYCCCSPYHHL